MTPNLVPLGHVLRLQRGISWAASQEREQPGTNTYPVLRIPNIQDRLDLTDVIHVKLPKARAEQFRVGQQTILMVGSNGNPHRVGNAVFIDRDPGFLYASFLMAARVSDPTTMEPRYVFHFISSPRVQDALTRSVQGSTGLKNLSERVFDSIRIPALPLAEQRRIAEILDTIDKVIASTEKVITKHRQIRRGLVYDLLLRGVDEDDVLRDPEKMPERFQDSPWGLIPRSWEIRSIGSLAVHVGSGLTPRGGREVYTTSGALFVRSQNVTFDGLQLDDVAYIDVATHRAMRRSEIFPFDVLINITGASIGRCCWVPPDLGPANVNQHVCAIRLPEASLDDAVVLTSILSSYIGQMQVRQLNAGSNREGLNYEQLRSILVPWPPAPERRRLAKVILEFDDRLRSEQRSLEKLQRLKQGLMDDLLSGKVRVPVHEEVVS